MDMVEHLTPPSPDDLLRWKDDILDRWARLPPDHQATMAVVLLQQALEGQYGPWLRSTVRVMGQPETDSPFRFLPVIRISHTHLAQAHLTEAEIGQLDDEDMMQISHAIVRHYTSDVFWEELEFQARLALAQKRPGDAAG